MSLLDYQPRVTEESPSTIRSALGWAIFLACSWTWCIGMFLPVLLVRDYGGWGWIVFAVPNVIGAAAMGWILRSGEISRRIVENHRVACLSFSAVTILFHVLFTGWVIQRLAGPLAWSALGLGIGYLFGGSDGRRQVLLAAITFVLSVLLFAIFHDWHDGVIQLSGRGPFPMALAYLAPVCVFGFGLCPYLDLTFHRARQHAHTQEASRLAFSIGFGLFFLLMIYFTLAYFHAVVDFFFPFRSGATERYQGFLVAIHMIGQTAFTVGIHSRQILGSKSFLRVTLIGGIMLAILCIWSGHVIAVPARMELGEFGYRCFLGFYGLIFPAYVWICMVGSSDRPPDRNRLLTFAIAVVLAIPFFYMGFIQGRMFWLLPGVAVVLLARFALSSRLPHPPG